MLRSFVLFAVVLLPLLLSCTTNGRPLPENADSSMGSYVDEPVCSYKDDEGSIDVINGEDVDVKMKWVQKCDRVYIVIKSDAKKSAQCRVKFNSFHRTIGIPFERSVLLDVGYNTRGHTHFVASCIKM